ncbi:hypothetical protein [Clostridium tunisiense]|uniref:hypothetical protein n=1 Tax=Clostridium tunisiense TaxID=219748 RepID=UPI00037EAB76|nr:hypothetical protein [Clostridium tunisiense]
MKKNIIIIFSIIIIFTLYSGSSYFKEQSNVKRAAWEQLGPEAKDFIEGSWRSGKVRKVTLSPSMRNISEEAYIGKEIYVVSFTTKEDNPTINTIGIFVSIEDCKVIGTGCVD